MYGGAALTASSGDRAPALTATINYPSALAVSALGDVYFSDYSTTSVRVCHPDGSVAVFAGDGSDSLVAGGDGGPARMATLDEADSLCVLPNDDVLIGANNCVRRVSARDATISTIAGVCDDWGDPSGSSGGPATLARLGGTHGLGADAAGNVYIGADAFVYKVWASSGSIDVVAGTGVVGTAAARLPHRF